MIEETKIFQLAHKVGIRIDAFGCPVVDKTQMLVDFAREVEKELNQQAIQLQLDLAATKRLPKRTK